jgi:DDE superfamily endonuclease
MDFIPPIAQPLLLAFAPTFTHPTFERWLLLCVAAIVTPGRRTISNLLRTVATLVAGHPSSYHRVFSHRRWTLWGLGHALTHFILTHWVPDGPVALAGDDTVEEHPGRKVFGKARHRDPVRSSHTFTAWRWGHKWVVLSILVQFPFARRPWALPVLVALYRSEAWNTKHGRRHKTPAMLLRQLAAVLIHWFPQRQFLLAGDGSYGTHELARFAHRYRRHLTLVSRFYATANLYAPPPTRSAQPKAGRPRTKGPKQPSPQQVVARAKRQRLRVRWYGGTIRQVEVVSQLAHWYKTGHGLVLLRWVFVHDCTGTHRDEYFFTTAPALSPKQIIELYTGRWSLATTFQELRAYLGLETTCGWTQATVLRAAPCLFGLFSVVALLYAHLPACHTHGTQIAWTGKQDVTFSDALAAVRRWVWSEWIFVMGGHQEAFSQLPDSLRNLLLYALAPAA